MCIKTTDLPEIGTPSYVIYSINLVHQTDNQVITQLSYPGGPTVQFLLEKTMEVPKSWGHPLVLFMFAG